MTTGPRSSVRPSCPWSTPRRLPARAQPAPTAERALGRLNRGAAREAPGRWILDTASADYDQAWLDYQHEIGLRHHRTKKNQTDAVPSISHINYRYLPTLVYPITATLKPFLARKGHSRDEVERMQQAWLKSVLLQVTLWSWPYVREGDF